MCVCEHVYAFPCVPVLARWADTCWCLRRCLVDLPKTRSVRRGISKSHQKCESGEPIRPVNKKGHASHYCQSKHVRAAHFNKNIYIKRHTKDHLLKENNNASRLTKLKHLWKPKLLISKEKWGFHWNESGFWGRWSRIDLSEAHRPQCSPFSASFSDCTAILGTSDDSVLATSPFFHCRKKLFIILPITQHCLSNVIKQRERSQSKFAFFRGEWLCQLE